MKTVLVFGTFDQLHPGHEHLLKQAHALGDRLIVSLTQDAIVQKLKKQKPIKPFLYRKHVLENNPNVCNVIPGDKELGSFGSIEKIQPDIIALGYDQYELKKELDQWLDQKNKNIPIISISSFKPEQFKSSLLRKNG